MIQNELILVLAEEVLLDIKSELQTAPFFAIILDTTQDVSKKDQLSEVFRYVKIDYHYDGTPSELKVIEASSKEGWFDNVCDFIRGGEAVRREEVRR